MADKGRVERVPSKNALRLLRARISRLEKEQQTIRDVERLQDEKIRAIEIRIKQISIELAIINAKEEACECVLGS